MMMSKAEREALETSKRREQDKKRTELAMKNRAEANKMLERMMARYSSVSAEVESVTIGVNLYE